MPRPRKIARNRKIVYKKDVLGWSFRQIAAAHRLSRSAVSDAYYREKANYGQEHSSNSATKLSPTQ